VLPGTPMRIPRGWPGVLVFVLAALALLPSPSRASRDTTCTQWRLDAPHPVPDGGVESSQCTCVSWNSYGDPPPPRYACNLCGYIPAFVDPICLERGADLPAPPQGCSASGGWTALEALVLVPALLFRRRVLNGRGARGRT